VNLSLPSGIIINIGSGLPTTVMNLAETLLKVSNFKVPIQITGQYRAGDIRHNYADITLLQKYLNFEPRISLEQGLKEFCEWALTQPIHEDLSVKAEFELQANEFLILVPYCRLE
jgi:dTDP-L-rhamnose 4-epimerase